MHAHAVKVTFPISANYSRFSEVHYGSSHQQERQIPSQWDSCFMPRITNWIVWGSLIYLNTKVLFTLILWSLNLNFKLYQMLCREKRNKKWLALWIVAEKTGSPEVTCLFIFVVQRTRPLSHVWSISSWHAYNHSSCRNVYHASKR